MKIDEYKKLSNLVKKVQKGDVQAFADIYSIMYQKIYVIVLQNISNSEDAQDIVQTVFTKVLASINDLNDSMLFTAWINKITYSTVMTFLSKKPDNRSIDEDENIIESESYEQEGDTPESVFIKNERETQIYKEINKLPEHYKNTLLLRYFEHLKISEIAFAMDCSEGTVKSRLYNAKKMLKDHLKQSSMKMT